MTTTIETRGCEAPIAEPHTIYAFDCAQWLVLVLGANLRDPVPNIEEHLPWYASTLKEIHLFLTAAEAHHRLALRGQSIRRFIGQAFGPFLLPCHQYADRKGWDVALSVEKPQCAGAAMFRDLVGAAERMPADLSKLDGDPALVFASAAEAIAHHEGCTLEEASEASVGEMLRAELEHSGVRLVKP